MCRANEMLAIQKLNEWKDEDEEEGAKEYVIYMHMSVFSVLWVENFARSL